MFEKAKFSFKSDVEMLTITKWLAQLYNDEITVVKELIYYEQLHRQLVAETERDRCTKNIETFNEYLEVLERCKKNISNMLR